MHVRTYVRTYVCMSSRHSICNNEPKEVLRSPQHGVLGIELLVLQRFLMGCSDTWQRLQSCCGPGWAGLGLRLMKVLGVAQGGFRGVMFRDSDSGLGLAAFLASGWLLR